MRRMFLLALVCAGTGLCAFGQRLPKTVVPESYELTFAPDLAKASFTGDEMIRVRVMRPTSAITLNAAELEFVDARVTAGGSTQKATVKLNTAREQATLTVTKQLPAGPAEIRIHFNGILNDKLHGFYLSKSKRRSYAVTQFENTDARRAFPSFDEPAFKAVYNITLIVDKGDTAISNGSIVSDTAGPGEGKHTLRFSPSPKMSSYLVAMLVGDFVCREGGADGIPIRVCSPPEQKEMTGFALEASENILKFYDRYYSIKYPYKKLDHIVFPDFAAGAMENAGAITYRDSALLVDPKMSSYDTKQNVASVIAHEMAHQWFGDLVTMEWWNDIWLNEGFATWMSDKPLEAWKPEWNIDQQEIAGSLSALTTDSIASVRTIRANAETPAEITALFDGIAYGKAAAVLRMVEAYVGPETFRKGVNAYLEKHAYGNATAEDFWAQIAETSGKPVDKIMKSFTEQPGAPLVNVSSNCRGDKMLLTLKQERYFSDSARLAADSDQLWSIPVQLLPSSTGKPEYRLLNKREETFELAGCSEWVYANAGARGYYRTGYDAGAFAKISAQIANFSPEDRVRIPSDAWALVRVGRMKIGDYLDLLTKMQGERSRMVLQIALGRIADIHDNMVAEADRPAFEKWVRELIRPMFASLGDKPAPGEPAERQALRADLFTVLARYGHDPESIARARTIADQYMKAPESVDAEVAGNALAIAAKDGDAALYDRYVAHLHAARTPEEYGNYLGALGVFPDPALTRRTFELVLGPDVKNQDMSYLFFPLANYSTQPAAWELFKTHFQSILKKVDASDAVDFAQVAGVFCDEKLRDDSQRFFAEQKLPGTARILQNQRDAVNACIHERELQRQNLSDYLKR